MDESDSKTRSVKYQYFAAVTGYLLTYNIKHLFVCSCVQSVISLILLLVKYRKFDRILLWKVIKFSIFGEL